MSRFERLEAALVQSTFKPSKCDPSLYIQTLSTEKIDALFYRDDILITRPSNQIIKELVQSKNSFFLYKLKSNI